MTNPNASAPTPLPLDLAASVPLRQPFGPTSALVVERLEKYKRHCEILRQIHSNKAFKYKTRADLHNVVLIVVSAFATFLGFTGLARIRDILKPLFDTRAEVFELIFNSLVFLILALTILNLVFRFQEKAGDHNRGIVQLTGLIRDLDDLVLFSTSIRAPRRLIREIRQRYKSITESLPPSTDKEFFRSKEDFLRKRKRSDAISSGQPSESLWKKLKNALGK
jgi:hypothetical protein